ncbi:MAG: hypothetical protein HQL25_03580 [Candidatus Omnitrophica bacterium]|nr:hypothetical protein [Candidatus Omnitrophota bacterium]
MLKEKNKKGQVVLELAAFVAVVVFIMGMIIKQSMDAKYTANGEFRAFRLALKSSFMASKGYMGGGGEDGNKSRNTAAIIVIEDRLDAGSGRYETKDRVPRVAQGSAIASVNLFYTVDAGETFNEPVMDLYINSQHFVLSTAKLERKTPTGTIYERIANGDKDYWREGDVSRFDIYRDGTKRVTDPNLMKYFEWQWMVVPSSKIDVDKGNHLQVDIDGDLKDETIIKKWLVMDNQDGDIDLTYDEHDADLYDACKGTETIDGREYEYVDLNKPKCSKVKWRSGLTSNATFLSQPSHGKIPPQMLETQEKTGADGKKYAISKKFNNKTDIIEREIRLANYSGALRTYGYTTGTVNPVAVTCSNPVPTCCFGDNYDKTCIFKGGKSGNKKYLPVVYVRSSVGDTRTKGWVTDVSDQNAGEVFGK